MKGISLYQTFRNQTRPVPQSPSEVNQSRNFLAVWTPSRVIARTCYSSADSWYRVTGLIQISYYNLPHYYLLTPVQLVNPNCWIFLIFWSRCKWGSVCVILFLVVFPLCGTDWGMLTLQLDRWHKVRNELWLIKSLFCSTYVIHSYSIIWLTLIYFWKLILIPGCDPTCNINLILRTEI